MTDVAFGRVRELAIEAIHAFCGRRGDYTPKHPAEEEHLRYQDTIETIRRQIVTSALAGLATHLSRIAQGRKTIVFVSERFTQPPGALTVGLARGPAAPTRTPALSGRLLDRRGRPLTDLPGTPGGEGVQMRLALGNLGPGDYVIELTARDGDEAARQYVAFRVVR